MTKKIIHPISGEIPLCPKCGEPLIHVRLWNKDLFGTGKDNPFIGWVCRNQRCKGWYCDYCECWHPYGTGCSVAMVRNARGGNYITSDPNWRHRDEKKEFY